MAVSVKSHREIELMREAGKILGTVLNNLTKEIKPGMSTWHIDKMGEDMIRSFDCVPSFLGYGGYPASICVSINDEVVHGKGSMMGKMPGETLEAKAENLRAAYGFMMSHPGKKLLFMGQEFAQWNEWSEERALDWYLLDDPSHKEMQQFTKKCMKLYSSYPCLYATDYKPEGFAWINANDVDNSTYR